MRREQRNSSAKREQEAERHNPFKINLTFKGPIRRRLFSPTVRLMERMLFLDHMQRIYTDALDLEGEGDFMERLLKGMNVRYELSDEDRARIPQTGPAIVVANHPYGGVEAIMLCALLRSVRPDAKIMANYFLQRIPEVSDYCIFVDPFGGDTSMKANIGPLKQTLKLLKGGGMLGVFPAGEVSHMDIKKGGIVDPPWDIRVARIIHAAKAPVVPLYVDGTNGPLFQIAGMIHPRIRTAMIPHELANKRNRTIRVSVGTPIEYESLGAYSSDQEMMDYLQFRTYVLANRHMKHEGGKKRPFRRRRRSKEEPIAPPEDPQRMADEVAAMPKDCMVAENGDLQVWVAGPEQIPSLLNEIGRLRETTFREEKEGTGLSRDLDKFDKWYKHLFMWNSETHEVVGAYRLGRSDEIVAKHGKRGLYTSTLFRYRKSMLNKISPALEVGRSFIRPEYQKSYTSLLLLWKGIGHYCVKHPKYNNLFGPVSISNEYGSISKRLLRMFLRANKFEDELSKMVKPKRPPRRKKIKGCATTILSQALKDVDAVSTVISDIENDNKGVPILLKQYLRLGGKLLGFNMDPDFGNVMDGLILVDLAQLARTDARQLSRFMGKDGIKDFAAYHGIDLSEQPKKESPES